MLNNEFLNKDPNVVFGQAPVIILDSKSSVCVYNLGKDIKHTRHIPGIIHLLRCIRDNNNLRLIYYSMIEYATLFDLLRQSVIKTYRKFIVLTYFIWLANPDTGRSKGEHILIYQGGPIDHYTHVTGQFS